MGWNLIKVPLGQEKLGLCSFAVLASRNIAGKIRQRKDGGTYDARYFYIFPPWRKVMLGFSPFKLKCLWKESFLCSILLLSRQAIRSVIGHSATFISKWFTSSRTIETSVLLCSLRWLRGDTFGQWTKVSEFDPWRSQDVILDNVLIQILVRLWSTPALRSSYSNTR